MTTSRPDPSGTLAVIARTAVLLSAIVAAACSPARREVQSDIVRNVRFDGNGGWLSDQNDLQLRAPMEQHESPPLTFNFPFMYFTQPVPLDVETLEADGRRIAVWYAHHGWFDARFLGWEIQRVRERRNGLAGVVDIVGHVEPNAPSVVAKIDVIVDGERELKRADRILWTSVVGHAAIKTDDPFNLEYVRDTQRQLLEAYRNAGRAYAKVDLTIDAWPEKHEVDVTFLVEPGKVASFGELTITGETTIDKETILDTLMFTPADPEHPEITPTQFGEIELTQTQQRLYETGLFSMVNIKPDLSDPAQGSVPITLEVRDAKFRRVRVGGGVEFDYFLLRPQVTTEYRDVNVGGSGLQLDAKLSGGAIIGVVNQSSGGTPTFAIGSARVRFDYPWLLHRKLGISAGAYLTNDLQFGALPYWSLGADLGLRYSFTRRLYMNVGPRFEYFQYYNLTSAEQAAAQLQFGTGWTSNNYRLLSLDAGIRYDRRDDILSPHQGQYLAMDLRQSLPIPNFAGEGLDGSFLYTRVDAEARVWTTFRTSSERRLPFVLGARAHTRILVPWRTLDDVLPYPDKAFLGGPNSMRGFRTNQVGPYDLACSYEGGRPTPMHNNGTDYNVSRTYLPKGGALAIEGSTELRYEWKYGLTFAMFGDLGLLAGTVNGIAQPTNVVVRDMLRYSAGIGLRYATPIGPIRIDLGLRPLFAEDLSGPASTPGSCNTIDIRARPYDLISASRRNQLWSGIDTKAPPLAINLFLAIGEAF